MSCLRGLQLSEQNVCDVKINPASLNLTVHKLPNQRTEQDNCLSSENLTGKIKQAVAKKRIVGET